MRTNEIVICKYTQNDCKNILQLFYNTVHSINARDYTLQQLNAWAGKNIKEATWQKSLAEHYSIVAKINDKIVGFGDIANDGYLDRLYVHKDFQNIGIGVKIINDLENYSCENHINVIRTEASITAKGFFEKCGYTVLKKQRVKHNNIYFINFLMQKTLSITLSEQ